MSRGASDFTDSGWRRTVEVSDVSRIIAEGRGLMRGFTDVLTDEEIRALATGLTRDAGMFED